MYEKDFPCNKHFSGWKTPHRYHSCGSLNSASQNNGAGFTTTPPSDINMHQIHSFSKTDLKLLSEVYVPHLYKIYIYLSDL